MLISEATIQNVLQRDLAAKGHNYIIPNIYLGCNESDLISVTKAGFIYEYEIKLTRPDFNIDFKKNRHDFMENDLRSSWRAYFFFVTPVDLIKTDEIPAYAGHIEVTKNGTCIDKKRGKRFKAKKITIYQERQICRGLMIRFWSLRKQAYRERDQLGLF